TFNIASQDPATIRELLTEVCRRAGSRSRLVTVPVRPARLALDLLWSLRLSPWNPEHRPSGLRARHLGRAARAGIRSPPARHGRVVRGLSRVRRLARGLTGRAAPPAQAYLTTSASQSSRTARSKAP